MSKVVQAITPEELRAWWPSKTNWTDEDVGLAWFAWRKETKIQEFMKRTGLPREQVQVVVHAPSGKAFVQWSGAVPEAIREEPC